jgi:hypothetical protein
MTLRGESMIKRLAGTLVAAGTLLALAAPVAQAAPPEPFTITETIDFTSEEPPTFTASGPLCASGTFEDEVIATGGSENSVPRNSKINFQIRTTYTCEDGSGTFFAQKHVFATLNEDGSSTNTGPITFHGGTGAFIDLSGHGVDTGTATSQGIGEGLISGVIKLG